MLTYSTPFFEVSPTPKKYKRTSSSLGAMAIIIITALFAPDLIYATTAWRVDGRIEAGGHADNLNGRYMTNRFVLMLVQNGEWHVELTSSFDSYRQIVEMACDKSNIFVLVHHAGGTTTIGTNQLRYQKTGQIYPGNITHFSNPGAASLWWLLCSPFAEGYQNGNPDCPDFFGARGFGLVPHVYLTNFADVPDGHLGLERSEIFLSPPLSPDEVPLIRLKTLEFAKSDGISYPRVANVEVLNPAARDRDGNPEVFSFYKVYCNSVQAISEPATVIPNLDVVTSVSDKRMAGVRVEYIGRQWLPLEQAQLLLSNKAAVAMPLPQYSDQKIITTEPHVARSLIVAIGGMTTILFFGFIWRSLKTNKEQTKTEQT